MNYFLAKTEPSTYSIDDLEREGTTLWDGVHNYEAINYIKLMEVGDRVFVYHSLVGKRIVGEAEVIEPPFENTADSRYSWAVRLRFVRKIAGPSLAEFKSNPLIKDFKLVTHSRLSVMPIPPSVMPMLEP